MMSEQTVALIVCGWMIFAVAAAITFETWSAFAYGQRLKKLRQKWGIE